MVDLRSQGKASSSHACPYPVEPCAGFANSIGEANVRELHEVLSRALIMSATADVSRQEIDEEILQIERKPRSDVFSRTRESGFALSKRLERIERAFIEDALEETDGVQKKAAKLLGVNESTLSPKIKRLGITP